MAYIPKNAEWFIAQLVEEFRVEGHRRNIVHINYVLIQAATPNEAYGKAMQLGKIANSKWKNPKSETVIHRFLGLRELDVIHDPLEHGCEIMFVERVGISSAETRKLVRKKAELEAFLPIRPRRNRPDYSSKKIMSMVAKELKNKSRPKPPSADPNK